MRILERVDFSFQDPLPATRMRELTKLVFPDRADNVIFDTRRLKMTRTAQVTTESLTTKVELVLCTYRSCVAPEQCTPRIAVVPQQWDGVIGTAMVKGD